MNSSRLSQLDDIIRQIHQIRSMVEELQLTKRDPISRIGRRLVDRASPRTRDILRARRERKARDREHAMKNVKAPPRKTLSTRMRTR